MPAATQKLCIALMHTMSGQWDLMQLSFSKGWHKNNVYLACWESMLFVEQQLKFSARIEVQWRKNESSSPPQNPLCVDRGKKTLARNMCFNEHVALEHFVPPKALCLRQVGRLAQLFLARGKPNWNLQALWEATSRKKKNCVTHGYSIQYSYIVLP